MSSRGLLECGAAIFNIRATLQRYKDGKPPETTKYYYVSSHDLLEMLDMTWSAWCSLQNIETEKDKMISGLIEAAKKG